MPQVPASQVASDALSRLLDQVQVVAHIYKHRDYCGRWAIVTRAPGLLPFHLVDRGEGWLHVEGRAPVPLQAGDLVLFPRDIPHVLAHAASAPPQGYCSVVPDTRERDEGFASILCGFLAFDAQAMGPLLADLPDVVLLADARRQPRTAGIGLIVEAMLLELEHDQPGRAAALAELARLLFLHVLRDCLARGASTGYLAALAHPRLGRALAAMHARLGERWTLDALASEAGMSRSAFADAFREQVGRSPMRYVADWRMQEATRRLTRTRHSVERIAAECGYDSPVAFRKAFRQLTGHTPRAVREAAGAALHED